MTEPIHATTSLLPCAVCGIGVADAEEVIKRQVPLPERPMAGDHVPPTRFGDGGTFTTCPGCRSRREIAAEIVQRHPGLGARLGNRAADHVAGALDVLAAIGHLGEYRHHLDDVASVMQLIRCLGSGSGVRFELVDDAATRPPSATPWEHLGSDADLRAGYGRLLGRRVARSQPDQPVTPPSGGGCVLCGVGAIVLSAVKVWDLGGLDEARARLWSSVTASPDTLGGRTGGARISGYTCPDCRQALDDAGAVGYGAMIRSFVAAMRRAGRGAEAAGLTGPDLDMSTVPLVTWAVTGRSPNTTAWAHVGKTR